MRNVTDFTKNSYKMIIGSDHGGWDLKNKIFNHLKEKGIDIEDVGPLVYDADDDYPDYANILAAKISSGAVDCGILICKSGIGMCINANRYRYVRAALVTSESAAAMSREHNNANVLVIGSNNKSNEEILDIINLWLNTPFSTEERHRRRINKIETNPDNNLTTIADVDPEIAGYIKMETARQSEILELIASENIVPPAVQAAQGSCLTNKYAEGYPGKRYYDGCDFVDDVEHTAIERVKKIFGAESANVQPHSGSQANMAVYFALLEPGDKVLAMDLAHGGHLTHGHKINFSGRYYDFIGYGVDKKTEYLDYDNIEALALENRPKMILAGASAYPRIIDFPRLKEIADKINAFLMVDMAHFAGLAAAGIHPNPVPYADVVTSTTHKTLRGPRGGLILCKEKYLKKINSQIFPGIQGGPLMHVIAAKAICFKEAMTDEFKHYQAQIAKNAKAMADELAKHGFRIVSGGTDNHLMLVDLRPLNTTGKKAASALDKAGITVNKNLIPFDPEKPFVTSGLRIGTPAVTTRGLKETHMKLIADWIYTVVKNIDNETIIADVRSQVKALTNQFPIPTV